jgi:3-oxoacyl-[acyl-carrier protein] reductase
MSGAAPLQGQVAVVTGAGRGIGAAIAVLLAGDGAAVVVDDLQLEPAAQTAAQIEAAGGRAIAVEADVAGEPGVEALMSAARDAFGDPTILVNNAGAGRMDMPVAAIDGTEFRRIIDINLTSQFLCARAVLPAMVRAGYGRIVNIGSRAWLGFPGEADYGAAKGGTVSLTRALALEVGRHGVTVNAVAPSAIITPAMENLPAETRERLRSGHPGSRFGEPVDVARAVRFLALPASAAITGQLLYACGGRSLRGSSRAAPR